MEHHNFCIIWQIIPQFKCNLNTAEESDVRFTVNFYNSSKWCRTRIFKMFRRFTVLNWVFDYKHITHYTLSMAVNYDINKLNSNNYRYIVAMKHLFERCFRTSRNVY